jgi:hypothetical protein
MIHLSSLFSKEKLKKIESNISKAEREALVNLSRNTNIVVLRPDKGNDVVILNKKDCVHKMNNLLNDDSKFKKITDIDILKDESRINRIFFSLYKCGALDIETYNSIHAVGSKPSRMYGLPKLHKNNIP